MEQQDLRFCLECAKRGLSDWKGWPHKVPVPPLTKLDNDVCKECGCSDVLESSRIGWLNVHGPFSTGLPDYWVLTINGHRNFWGYPYYLEGRCRGCGEMVVVSQMQYPGGEVEFKSNCESCGVLNPI